MDKTFIINVDGVDHAITADPVMPLLYALRNDLGKKGPRFGCGLAQCGACTVIQDGVAIRSCVVPIAAINGKVRTLDGLGTTANPHPVQRAFIAEEAGQSADYTRFRGMNGRIDIIVLNNPNDKILHTVLVEKNGFIHSLTFATPYENQAGKFYGPSAYQEWIQPD